MMAGKLGTDSAYQGIVFTAGLRDKLQAITTGSFAYTDSNGTSHAQVEGYVMTSQVVGELKKKADRLLGGYSASEKETVATNLDLYTKAGADARFATLENLFQDYINFLVRQGKSTSEAQQFLQGKLNVLSKNEIVRDYLRRDSKLSDLLLPTAEARRQACRALGACLCRGVSAVACGYRMGTDGEQRIGYQHTVALRPPNREHRFHTGCRQYGQQGRKQLGRYRGGHPQQNTTTPVQCALHRH